MGTPKTAVEVLIAARELISVPERWTQRSVAKDIFGNCVPENESSAVCWCSLGAISRCSTAIGFIEALSVLGEVTGVWPGEFNDHSTHAEVLAAFDKAIELARAEEA